MRRLRQYICAATLAMGAMAPAALPQEAFAQSIEFRAQTSRIYAGMPFTINILLKDFDESPQPEISPFEIEGATVQLLGVSPQVSSMTTIINGKITSHKDVSFSFAYQVTPKREGTFSIPALHAHQGAKEATSQEMTFTATSVAQTSNMKLELQIPNRKFWVGETFEATLSWYLRKDVQGQVFNIPILEMPDTFEVTEPDDVMRGQAINLTVGSRTVQFPFTRDSVMKDGTEYTRFTIPIKLTPLKSGEIEIPSSRVLAELESGQTRDGWGFPRTNYELFQAEDTPKTCSVLDLPQASKPATFTNAMGSEFEISVSADRTIVKSGEPINLTIDISSPSSMEGLILPSLISAGLNDQLFNVGTENPIGVNVDGDGKRNKKRFTVPVRIKSDRVTEIPPLAFSYFNPKTSEFTTVRSQPIALSVTSVEKVGAADVYSAKKDIPAAQPAQNSAPAKSDPVILDPTAGALELNQTANAASLKSSDIKSNGRLLRIGIYVAPFLLWIALAAIRRSRKTRSSSAPQRDAALALKKALDDAENQPARDAAGNITNALNGFLTATETPRAPFQPLCERMDNDAYRPNAQHLPPELIKEFRETAKNKANPAFAKIISSIFALLIAISCCVAPESAFAQSDDDAKLSQAIQIYNDAMAKTDRTARLNDFKRAYTLYSELADAHPASPELAVDAGNAALNAMDFGHAALAYKRALELDPANAQAQNNLAYIQAIQGESHKNQKQLISSAFVLNRMFSTDTCLLIAAILFALGILLIIPWSPRHRKITAHLATIPLILWLWVLVGTMIRPDKNEAIVMSEYYLKTADNPGSSNVSATPLEPGNTVEILRDNRDWLQVQTPNGHKGWIQRTSAEPVKRN